MWKQEIYFAWPYPGNVVPSFDMTNPDYMHDIVICWSVIFELWTITLTVSHLMKSTDTEFFMYMHHWQCDSANWTKIIGLKFPGDSWRCCWRVFPSHGCLWERGMVVNPSPYPVNGIRVGGSPQWGQHLLCTDKDLIHMMRLYTIKQHKHTLLQECINK